MIAGLERYDPDMSQSEATHDRWLGDELGTARLRVRADAGQWAVTSLDFVTDARGNEMCDVPEASALIEQAWNLVDRLLSGEKPTSHVPLAPAGTRFQRRVWDELLHIGPGETKTYGQVAAAVGSPGGARAVGGACRRNPIAILIPCHRVVDSCGQLHGYAGGLERKRVLLEREGVVFVRPEEAALLAV